MSSHKQNIEIENNKLFPIVTIFLGALGSGLWEFILRDFSYFLLSWITSTADSIFSGFADSFYSSVGRAVLPSLISIVPFLVVMFIILLPWMYTFNYYRRTSGKIDDSVEVESNELYVPRRKKNLAVFFPVMAVIITILYGNFLAADINNFKSSNYIERSIEILRPHLIESMYYELRSEYRQVETRDQFEKLYIKLNSISSKNDILLPDFSPLMIDDVPNK